LQVEVEEDVLIRAITFIAAPSERGCFAAAITCGHRPGIALCRLGMDANGTHRWTVTVSAAVYGIEDVVYFEQGIVPGFHLINDRGNISAAHTGGTDHTLNMIFSKVQGEEDDVFSSLPDSVHFVGTTYSSGDERVMDARLPACAHAPDPIVLGLDLARAMCTAHVYVKCLFKASVHINGKRRILLFLPFFMVIRAYQF
jgi:hypothetical protein